MAKKMRTSVRSEPEVNLAASMPSEKPVPAGESDDASSRNAWEHARQQQLAAETEYPPRLVVPFDQYRRLHLHVRREAIVLLGDRDLPKSWAPEDEVSEIGDSLEWMSNEFDVPAADLHWLLLKLVPESWKLDSEPGRFPARLKELLGPGVDPMSMSISAYLAACVDRTSLHYRFRYYLYSIVTRHRPSFRQIEAVLTALLRTFNAPLPEAESRFGAFCAESLDDIQRRVATGRIPVALEVLGALWHQVWGDRQGQLLQSFSRFGPSVVSGGETVAWHRVGVTRPRHGLRGMAEGVASHLLKNNMLSGSAARVASCLAGDAYRGHLPGSRLIAAGPEVDAPDEPGSTTTGATASPQEDRSGSARPSTATGQGKTSGHATKRKPRAGKKPKEKKRNTKKRNTKKKPRKRRATREADVTWLSDMPKDVQVHPGTAEKLWKTAVELREFTRRQLQENCGIDIGPAKRFLTFAEKQGKLRVTNREQRRGTEPHTFEVVAE